MSIPEGATIQSARMHLVKSGDEWIHWEFYWYGEASGDAATFSAASTPEDRLRTTAYVSHSDNVQHLDGVRYELDEIKSVVQEIVDRQDWTSGNSLVILARADWEGWSEKFWRTYDYSATDAAQLVVTYVVSDELEADFVAAPLTGAVPLTVTFTNLAPALQASGSFEHPSVSSSAQWFSDSNHATADDPSTGSGQVPSTGFAQHPERSEWTGQVPSTGFARNRLPARAW